MRCAHMPFFSPHCSIMSIYARTQHIQPPFMQPETSVAIVDLLCNLPGASPKKDVLLRKLREKFADTDIHLPTLFAEICGDAYPLPDDIDTFSLVLSLSVSTSATQDDLAAPRWHVLAQYMCHETLALRNLHTHFTTNISLNHPRIFPSREKSPFYEHLLRAQTYHAHRPYLSWDTFTQPLSKREFAFKAPPFSHIVAHNVISNKDDLEMIHLQTRTMILSHLLNNIRERKHDGQTFNHAFNLLSWLTTSQFALLAEHVTGISPLLPTYIGCVQINANLSFSIQNQDAGNIHEERKRVLRAIFFSEHDRDRPYPVAGDDLQSNCILVHTITDEHACIEWKGANAVFVDFTILPGYPTERNFISVSNKSIDIDSERLSRVFVSPS